VAPFSAWAKAVVAVSSRASMSVPEDDGLAVVQEYPFLKMVEHRAGKHALFDIAAQPDKVLRRIGMADSLDVLVDDRAFIEFAGNVMRGRPDHLHAAGMSLMIGPGALEPGQETVVNINAASGQEGR